MKETNSNQHLLRRTKIIVTLGPATDDPNVMDELIVAGINVVRLNFSHGLHEEHKKRIELARASAKKHDRVIGVLADLQGPKIRVSQFKARKVILKNGEPFILDADLDDASGDESRVGIGYKNLPKDVDAGDILLLDDGRITLEVSAVKGSQIHCKVLVGGELSNNKGINRKGGGLSARALTEKDKKDLSFALKQDVDFIAISFPRNADDVNETRELIEREKGDAAIIAKIERAEAVDEIDEIIDASDGVMVARGDLAVEIGDAQVPLVQKHIIKRARDLDKPVIIATQMMESMIHSTVPTRAEVSDVANGVLENADAVMLSAETAAGDYPVDAVKAMDRVCVASEQQSSYQVSGHRVDCRFRRIDETIAMATMYTANHYDISAVVALTESGATTLWMSRIRTAMPIYGLSRFKRALGKMCLYRGVYPIDFDVTKLSRDDVNRKSVEAVQEQSGLAENDKVILTKGDHLGVGGGSNAMKILVVGKVI